METEKDQIYPKCTFQVNRENKPLEFDTLLKTHKVSCINGNSLVLSSLQQAKNVYFPLRVIEVAIPSSNSIIPLSTKTHTEHIELLRQTNMNET